MSRRAVVAAFAVLVLASVVAAAAVLNESDNRPSGPEVPGVYEVDPDAYEGVALDSAVQVAGRPALSVLPGESLARNVTWPGGDTLVVPGRATSCDAGTALTVSLDGEEIGSLSLRRQWDELRVQGPFDPGTHRLELDVVGEGEECEPHVGTVQLRSSVVPNAGTPGSPCRPTDRGVHLPGPNSSVETDVWADAPAYHELFEPDGAEEGAVLILPGGGWYVVGEPTVRLVSLGAEDWRSRGWTALVATTRGCGDVLDDAEYFVDRAAELAGDGPLCVVGDSSAGHVALVLAAQRDDIDCVVGFAAPTDLTALASGGAAAENLGGLFDAAFGPGRRAELSPVNLADGLDMPMVLAHAQNDPVVPFNQLNRLLSALPDPTLAETVRLRAGEQSWVHSDVQVADIDAVNAAVRRTSDAVAR